MTNPDRWTAFFKLYNEGLSDAYERAMEGIQDEEQAKTTQFHEQLRHHVLNSMQSWYKLPHSDLDNRTPEAIIDELATIEEVVDKVKLAAACCDDDIPEYIKIKLGSFGGEGIVFLQEMALLPSWEGDYGRDEDPSDDLLSATAALKILGEWQVAEPLDAILFKFEQTNTPHELIADAVKNYIIGVGEPAITPLTRLLDNACNELAKARSDEANQLTGPYEYLIIALTLVSQQTSSDMVFSCLRQCFRQMTHKVIGAICLGDYGDPRGIAVLKGYLDRNEGRFDRQEFYEILSSIKTLGGEISDIKDPFRDFSIR